MFESAWYDSVHYNLFYTYSVLLQFYSLVYGFCIDDLKSLSSDILQHNITCCVLLHSTKEITVIMWTCHLRRHALDIPHRSNSFISRCIFHLIDDFRKPTTSNMRGITHLKSWWKMPKSQCMWKVHNISTFFSEGVVLWQRRNIVRHLLMNMMKTSQYVILYIVKSLSFKFYKLQIECLEESKKWCTNHLIILMFLHEYSKHGNKILGYLFYITWY